MLDVVVLTAFRTDRFPTDELTPWLEHGDWPKTVELPRGCADFASPLYHDRSVGVFATGVGPTAAATAVTDLLHTDVVDDETLFCTTGVAGGPPDLAVGSVVVAEAVVDWDRKHRTDGEVAMLDYRPREYVYDLDTGLVAQAKSVAESVVLDGDDTAVTQGTVVAGGEFWHGHNRADEVAWLCEQYGTSAYRATVTEDAGTAHALARHDALDRFVSIRAVSNVDRPTDDAGGVNSWEDGLELAVENAHRVGRAFVDAVSGD